MRRRCPRIRIAQKSFYLELLRANGRIAKPLDKFLSSLDDDNKWVAALFPYRISRQKKNGPSGPGGTKPRLEPSPTSG